MQNLFLSFALLIILTSSSAAQENPSEASDGKLAARLFAPDTISTGMFERDAALSPDGKSFYFTLRYTRSMAAIAYSNKIGEKWTKPRIAEFSGKYYDIEPVFHPDGKRLFFVSNRPIHKTGESKDFDIWYVTRREDGWSEPVNLGKPVNQEGNEFYPSFTRDGSIYFTAELDPTRGGEDLYVCQYQDGRFMPPKNLGDSVNTNKGEYNGFVSPDGSFIIYTSEGMGEGYGSGDLYIAFKNRKGQWRKAINMGEQVNSRAFEYCPALSADGKFLFFTSQRMARDIKDQPMDYRQLQKYHSKPENGNGDIYRIHTRVIDSLKNLVRVNQHTPQTIRISH
ncbi:MAG: PD40 domain-containing protein [Bacteroidales bacterium]|nr:PD40 domain-containing protein [Bacteroidales bacterium]